MPGLKQKAGSGRSKPERLDVNTGLDLEKYKLTAHSHGEVGTLGDLPEDLKDSALELGVDSREDRRSGSFFQVDHSVIFSRARQQGLEVMNITDAVRKHSWLDRYRWAAVPPDADGYTSHAASSPHHGLFVRALKGSRVEFPLQACFFMTQDGLAQNVHNVIIAEEGSELHVITGCGSALSVKEGLHVGITEYYVKPGATLTYTMIHSWGRGMWVRPRSAAIVEEGGIFISNYVSMKPVLTLQMDPMITCAGRDATARTNSILLAPEGTDLDVGARVALQKPGSRAEIVSRAITTGGNITARGQVTASVGKVKAHLECRGLILSDSGRIQAVPELVGLVKDVDLSHEAAVGRINEEQITYLMARGLTEDEAAAAIVRGFLDVRIEGLPSHLADRIREAIEAADIKGL